MNEKQQLQFLVDPDKPVEEILTVIQKFLRLYPEQKHVILAEVQKSISTSLSQVAAVGGS